MSIKLKWKVGPVPTGRYRSFERRAWPSADYHGTEKCVVQIKCEDEYVPSQVKTANHAELKVMIADYSVENAFQWRTLTKRFATLEEAKEAVTKFLNDNPQYWPSTNNKE